MSKALEYNVVVVGAGNATLCAAIVSKEKVPKKKRGGNSFFTDGAIRFALMD